jgi:protein-disulfide isomerase
MMQEFAPAGCANLLRLSEGRMEPHSSPWWRTSERLLPAAALAAVLLALVSACSKDSGPQPSTAQAAPAPIVAQAGPSARQLGEEDARRILPRADLSGLNGEQRAQFLEIAGDVFDYAGCKDTLAKCLAADVKDVHALRMADLVKALVLQGVPPGRVIEWVEQYYASFDSSKRQKLRSDDCPQLGDKNAPVALVEFSDYQCPHCAVARKPLHDVVLGPEKGKARLCPKYFPLPGHPRAQIAAGCAEFAKRKGKFWEMHEALFAHQEELEDDSLKRYAQQIGLDGSQMLKEVYAGNFDAVIDAHKREGEAARVQATPTIFVNGRPHLLPVQTFFLQRSIEDELEWQQNKAFVYEGRETKEKKG